jgi:hypothetical protein
MKIKEHIENLKILKENLIDEFWDIEVSVDLAIDLLKLFESGKLVRTDIKDLSDTIHFNDGMDD